jgi:hypothetical protein
VRGEDRRPRLGQERLARRGEPHAARQPFDELPAELRLERRDLLRQAGLGHVQLGGGAREGARVDDRDPVLQLPQVHNPIFSPTARKH